VVTGAEVVVLVVVVVDGEELQAGKAARMATTASASSANATPGLMCLSFMSDSFSSPRYFGFRSRLYQGMEMLLSLLSSKTVDGDTIFAWVRM
jgi:hypothetical protein